MEIDGKTLLNDEELRPIFKELLLSQARKAAVDADIADIKLIRERDVEDDRLVKTGYVRHLSMNEVMVPPFTDDWIDALEHWERREPGAPLSISIMSPGGSVLDGFALYDTIARMQRGGSEVTVRGTGMVASMAAILLQVGDVRILDKSAFFMIHEISSGARGKLSELEDAQAFMKKLQDRALDILAAKSKLSKVQIARRWKRKDDYMTADEALALGFCDRVE